MWVHVRSDSLISGEGNEHIIYKLLILRCLRPTPNEILWKDEYSPHGRYEMVQVLIMRSLKKLKDGYNAVKIYKMSQKQHKKV